MKEALFYKKLENQKVKCELCHQFCQISPNQRGICGVRENQNGVLKTLVYGKVIAVHIDPIEKKPFYHFLPNSKTFSIATVGCNFHCANCQNADISQATKNYNKNTEIPGHDLNPEKTVALAVESTCPSISYTYTEPTVFFEYAFDCMKIAKASGLKNCWVSNGYTNKTALEAVKPYLDAANIDLKFFDDVKYRKICGGKLQPILDNLIWYKKNGIHLEITTLIIPNLNDSKEEFAEISKFIKNKLGAETPWHVSAFWPTYKLNDLPPTSNNTILKAKEIGEKNGLKYVYPGNINL